MRKAIFLPFIILVFGCSKEINSKSVNVNDVNQSQATVADTYLPLTKNTYWKYTVTTGSDKPDNSKLTVLGLQKIINGKPYQAVKNVVGKSIDTLYYAQVQNDYYLYTTSGTSGDDIVKMEMLFLKDNAAEGDDWTGSAGSANGVSLKYYGKIIEKNISLSVSDTTYKNVIHSYVEIRKPFLFSYFVVYKQDFYTAKNVGIIKNISTPVLPSGPATATKITGYGIK